MKKSLVDYKKEYDVLIKENTRLINYLICTTLVGACLLIATLLLARSGDELTTKVRNNDAYFNQIDKENIFIKKCLEIKGIIFSSSCYVNDNNVRLRTLEEIKQAKLHFDLGAKK